MSWGEFGKKYDAYDYLLYILIAIKYEISAAYTSSEGKVSGLFSWRHFAIWLTFAKFRGDPVKEAELRRMRNFLFNPHSFHNMNYC